MSVIMKGVVTGLIKLVFRKEIVLSLEDRIFVFIAVLNNFKMLDSSVIVISSGGGRHCHLFHPKSFSPKG